MHLVLANLKHISWLTSLFSCFFIRKDIIAAKIATKKSLLRLPHVVLSVRVMLITMTRSQQSKKARLGKPFSDGFLVLTEMKFRHLTFNTHSLSSALHDSHDYLDFLCSCFKYSLYSSCSEFKRLFFLNHHKSQLTPSLCCISQTSQTLLTLKYKLTCISSRSLFVLETINWSCIKKFHCTPTRSQAI